MTATTSTAKGSIAEWTIREQLILASAVQRSGDQNWVSVSRAVKPLVDDVRPADYFSQKNCALQYSTMLDKAGTPKRKRTSDGAPEVVETAEQQIVRQLTEKRINELNVSIQQTKEEYLALKKEIEQIEKGELDDKIPEMWQQINADLEAKEAMEKKRETNSASVKLKSPPRPGKRKSSPPPPANVGKSPTQLKHRKMKSPPPPPIVMEQNTSDPQPVPMDLCSPTSPTPILTSLKGEESAPPTILNRPGGGEKLDIVQPLPSKSSRAGIVPPLKLPLGGGAAATGKKDIPSVSPVSATTAASPMAKPLPVVMTPKEETLGGVPMQAPHPSTEGNLQLSSNMHVIVQQPNIHVALLDSGEGKKQPSPQAVFSQQPSPKKNEVQPPPPPSRAREEAVDIKIPSPKMSAPSVSISPVPIPASSSLKMAVFSPLATSTPAVASAAPPPSITAPHTIATTAAVAAARDSPTKMEKMAVKQQDIAPTTAPVHVAVTKDATPTTNATTPTMAQSVTLVQMNIPITAPPITTMPSQLATPTTSQITTPIPVAAATARAPEPVSSLPAAPELVTFLPAAPVPSNIAPTVSVPAVVQLPPPPPSAAAGPPSAAAGPPASLPVVATSPPTAVELPQPPPQKMELHPTAVQAVTQKVPSTLPIAQSSTKTVDTTTTISHPSVEAIKPSISVQPSSKMIESPFQDIQPLPMDVDVAPTKETSSIVAPPSSTAAQVPPVELPPVEVPPVELPPVELSPVEVPPSTKPEVFEPSPRTAPPATKAAPKFIQTTLKLAQGSPKITQPAPKVTKMADSPSAATKPSKEADETPLPETPPQVVEESPLVSQPSSSSAMAEPASTAAAVVTSTKPTPPVISPSVPVLPSVSKAKTPTKVKQPSVATSSGLLGSPSPLLSTHTPTPSPLVTTAMKAPLVSSAVKSMEEKAVGGMTGAPPTKGSEEVVKPKIKQESKTVTKKREREQKRSISEERTLVKSPSRKTKASPEKMETQEPGEGSRPGRKTSAPKRSPSTSPSSSATSARTSGAAAAARAPISPQPAKKGRDSAVTPKSPPPKEEEETPKEKSEEKKEEERASEETTSTPSAKEKEKEPVEESALDVSQPPSQEREKPATSVSVIADSPATPATPISGEKEAEPEEGGEVEETPVRAARTARKTLQRRSRKRKVDEEGPSVESTDTEEEVPSSAQTSAVPSPSPSLTGETDIETIQARKQWKKAIMLVWRHAAQHKYANLFLHPVREEDAPGYRDLILRPMDLSTIKRKIESGQIRTDMEFQRDMLLMFQNAFMYNSSDHDVFFMAQSMKSDVMENIQAYLATQAQLQLMGEEPLPQKTLRSREGRRTVERDLYEESLFSPAAKKRRLKGDD